MEAQTPRNEHSDTPLPGRWDWRYGYNLVQEDKVDIKLFDIKAQINKETARLSCKGRFISIIRELTSAVEDSVGAFTPADKREVKQLLSSLVAEI